MNSLTKDERRAVARRIFEALCAQYPDRYVTLVEQPGRAEPEAAIADSAVIRHSVPDRDDIACPE
jgi:hypothetical protein